MTYVTEEAVETIDERPELNVTYRDDRLVVQLSGRTITFSLCRDRQLAVLEDDTHQSEPCPEDIPDSVVRHILEAGWRLPAPATGECDGEHTIWTGEQR